MKPKIKGWRSPFVNAAMALAVAVVAVALLAHPVPAFASERKADAKNPKQTMEAKSLKQPKQTKPAVRDQDLGAKKNSKPGGKPPQPLPFTYVIDKASPVVLLSKRSSKKPEQKPLTKKAEGLSDAKEPKQTRQTKPVVRAQDLAAMSKVKKGGTNKPIKFDGIDGEFQDKDHKNWSVLESFSQSTHLRRKPEAKKSERTKSNKPTPTLKPKSID